MTRPTLDAVKALIGMPTYACFAVTQEDDGIRIRTDYYRGDDPELLGRIIGAALRLQLDPSQIKGQLCYEDGDSCPTCGYDPSFGIDVKFLFEPSGE